MGLGPRKVYSTVAMIKDLWIWVLKGHELFPELGFLATPREITKFGKEVVRIRWLPPSDPLKRSFLEATMDPRRGNPRGQKWPVEGNFEWLGRGQQFRDEGRRDEEGLRQHLECRWAEEDEWHRQKEEDRRFRQMDRADGGRQEQGRQGNPRFPTGNNYMSRVQNFQGRGGAGRGGAALNRGGRKNVKVDKNQEGGGGRDYLQEVLVGGA
jgi:hypothetical protein